MDSTMGTQNTSPGWTHDETIRTVLRVPHSGGGGRKAGRGHVKRGTRQGKERRRRRGPQVTRPQQGRKGLSTPSAQTWLVVVKAAGQIQET